jgi:hypothetical protein
MKGFPTGETLHMAKLPSFVIFDSAPPRDPFDGTAKQCSGPEYEKWMDRHLRMDDVLEDYKWTVMCRRAFITTEMDGRMFMVMCHRLPGCNRCDNCAPDHPVAILAREAVQGQLFD